MRTSCHHQNRRSAFTLLEMTVVIMVLIALLGLGLFSSRKLEEWKLGRAASESLRAVYTAQRMYLADNPTMIVGNLTETLIIPYLPNLRQPYPESLALAFPNVKPISGSNLGYNIRVSPPRFTQGGQNYDPSATDPIENDSRLRDSLWDVGE